MLTPFSCLPGKVVKVDVPRVNNQLDWLSREQAHVEFEKPEQAEDAMKFMNGGTYFSSQGIAT